MRANSQCDEMSESHKKELQIKSLHMAASLINRQLHQQPDSEGARKMENSTKIIEIVRGKFVDLCCEPEGEVILENLFDTEEAANEDPRVIQGAIVCLQSLAILGTQFGVTATAEQFEKSVAHLAEPEDKAKYSLDYQKWDASSTRRLKFRSERIPGLQLLAELKRKRSAQGAFDLLVWIGAWKKHEDLALLRSGCPLRFSDEDLHAAKEVSNFPRLTCFQEDNKLTPNRLLKTSVIQIVYSGYARILEITKFSQLTVRRRQR